jgi:hypothetical protein
MENQAAETQTPQRQNTELQMSVNELIDFSLKGRLPGPIKDYYQANDRLPGHLYVPLAKMIDGDMAAQERATAMGKASEARLPDDFRVQLYANDPVMRELIDPFRLERQAIALSRDEVAGLSRGELPTQVLDHTRQYAGELPATTIEPVRTAMIETTLERSGLMYPAFEQLYKNSLELPGLVDEPIREGLKEQGLLPADTTDWRIEIARQREESQAVALGIAEGIQTGEMSVALPDQAAHLRQYLEGDNYLSNEEISRAIFDSQTNREAMNGLVRQVDTSGNTGVQQEITAYLMTLKENVVQTPALQAIGHLQPVDVLSAMELGHQKELKKAGLLAPGVEPQLPSAAEQAINRELIDRLARHMALLSDAGKQPENAPENASDSVLSRISQLVTNGFRKETQQPESATVVPALAVSGQPTNPAPANQNGVSTSAIQEAVQRGLTKENGAAPTPKTADQSGQPQTDTQARRSSKADDESVIEKIAKLKLFSGGTLSNLVDNYKKGREILNKLIGGTASQAKSNDQKAGEAQPVAFTRAELVKLLDKLDHQERLRTTALKDQAPAPAVAQPQRQGNAPEPARSVSRPTLVSRMSDYFLDKLADKLAPRIQQREAQGQQPATESPVPTVVSGATLPGTTPPPSRDATIAPLIPAATAALAISETDRQQRAYIEQPKKYTWEQIGPQLEKIGVKAQHLDPMNKALLLDGRATRDQVPIMIHDKNGLSALATGQLMILEKPGKAPTLAIVPQGLKTEFKVPYGLNLYPEDILRLQKTGMANRPVERVNPETGTKTEYLVGYDRSINRITLIEKDKVKMPTNVLGKDLTPAQQQELSQGMPIRVEGLKAENGRAFSATMQFSASQQGIHVQPENLRKQSLSVKTEPLTPAPAQVVNPAVGRPDAISSAREQKLVAVIPVSESVQSPVPKLTDEQQKRWDNKTVEVAEGGNSNGASQKRMGDLTYNDVLVVRQATGHGTPAARIPLHDKGDRTGLLPPSEQARIAYDQIRSGTLGKGESKLASPAEIQAAELKYTQQPTAAAQKTTNTSVVEKNGASRITQDQTGYRPSAGDATSTPGKPGASARPVGQTPPPGAKVDQHQVSHNGQPVVMPAGTKPPQQVPVTKPEPPVTRRGPKL